MATLSGRGQRRGTSDPLVRAGVRTTSYNGWSVGGSLPVGVGRVAVGRRRTDQRARGDDCPRTARHLGCQRLDLRRPTRIVVNIASQNGSSSELGAAFMGVGLNFGATNDKTHQYQIEIDPAALQIASDGKPANRGL